MMTPDEIKAMLDLPEAARAKLAAIEGPGFYVSSEGGWCPRTLPALPTDPLEALVAACLYAAGVPRE